MGPSNPYGLHQCSRAHYPSVLLSHPSSSTLRPSFSRLTLLLLRSSVPCTRRRSLTLRFLSQKWPRRSSLTTVEPKSGHSEWCLKTEGLDILIFTHTELQWLKIPLNNVVVVLWLNERILWHLFNGYIVEYLKYNVSPTGLFHVVSEKAGLYLILRRRVEADLGALVYQAKNK